MTISYNAPADTPAGLALRALQKLDNGAVLSASERRLLVEAEDRLGEVIGLSCVGEPEGNGFYSHNGHTCPVHEWLVETDATD